MTAISRHAFRDFRTRGGGTYFKPHRPLNSQLDPWKLISPFSGMKLEFRLTICSCPRWRNEVRIFYRPHMKFAKVMFSQVCLPHCMLGYTPPPSGTRGRHRSLGRHPLGRYSPGQTPPRPCSACWDMVNKRVIRILLECILVTS